MNYYFITGVSRGIGKAIATELLKDNSNKVIGLGRHNSINHSNYSFQKLDMLEVEEVKRFVFPVLSGATSVHLINNAGILGEIKYVGEQQADDIEKIYKVNTLAPHLMYNAFIHAYGKEKIEKTMLSISSGAAFNPIDGWSGYCASKAAVNMLTQVLAAEEAVKNKGFKVYAVAPGVVDTEMQDHIRSSERKDFSRIQDFIDYKEKGELLSAEKVAEKLIRVVYKDKSPLNNIFSLRDLA